jgi:ankyrin repeat protein
VHSLLAEEALAPNITSKDGWTPFDCVVRRGDRKMVDFLLARGAY